MRTEHYDQVATALPLSDLGEVNSHPYQNVQAACLAPSFACLRSVLEAAREQSSVCFPASTEDSAPIFLRCALTLCHPPHFEKPH